MDQNSIEQIFQQKLEDLQIENHPTQLLEGLKLLLKLFDNIGQNPLEQKYRNIKATNTKIKQTIFNLDRIQQILSHTGFQFDGLNDTWYLPDQNLYQLLGHINQVRDFAALLEAQMISPEEYQKQLQIQQRLKEEKQKQQDAKQKEDKIKELMNCDKLERKHIAPAKDSIANKSDFGSKTKTCKDLGIGKQQRG